MAGDFVASFGAGGKVSGRVSAGRLGHREYDRCLRQALEGVKKEAVPQTAQSRAAASTWW